MRKTLLALAAIASLGIVVSASAPAFAQDARVVISTGDRGDGVRSDRSRRNVVVVNRRHDNGLHRGWYKNRGHQKHVTVIKRRGGDEGRSKTVIIRRD